LEFINFGGGGVLLRTAEAVARLLPDDGADRNPVVGVVDVAFE
jgi:hypothetical protein